MDASEFLARVEGYREGGWRLALINATTVFGGSGDAQATGAGEAVAAEGVFEITWGFARGSDFETIREQVRPGDEVPSVSASFGAAFLYENEMRELFGINVTGIDVDLRGAMYMTATRLPFSHRAVRARLEASGRSVGAVPAHGPGSAHGTAAPKPATLSATPPAAPATATPASAPATTAAAETPE